MQKINTVIFDLDGTLLDTLDDLTVSVNHALCVHGLPLRSRAEVRSFVGNGVCKLMERSVPKGISKEKFEKVFLSFKEHYTSHCLDQTRPYPGIMETLEQLQKRNVCMAIVSNKLQPAVTELNARFFSNYISVAVGESQTVRCKPCPDALLEALKVLGAKKEEAIYVGDSEVDIETARNAGLPCLSVLWGFKDEDFLRRLYPDAHFIHQPEEIFEYIR